METPYSLLKKTYITGKMTLPPTSLQITLNFKIGQAVMVKNHAHHTFDPKYLMVYRVPKTLHKSTLLLVTPNGREQKMNIDNVKPCTTLELFENTWNLFLESMKTKCLNHDYKLRPCDVFQHLQHEQYNYHLPIYLY